MSAISEWLSRFAYYLVLIGISSIIIIIIITATTTTTTCAAFHVNYVLETVYLILG